MAKPIIELTRGIPKTDREWIAVFSKLAKHLKVEGNAIVLSPDIVLPDGSVSTNEIEDAAVTAIKLGPQAVTNEKIRHSNGASVIGRSGSSTGVVADITAGADGRMLVRRAGVLTFDSLADGDIPSGIARDSEVASAISTHEAALDPHSGYTTTAELAAAISALNLASGGFTPTGTGVANTDSVTAFDAQYLRVGNIVTVSGAVAVDPTTITTLTQVGLSFPIASNIANPQECAGAGAPGDLDEACAIVGDATNNRAELRFIAASTSQHTIYYTYTYRII